MLRLAHRREGTRPQMKTSSRKRGTSIPTHRQEAKTRHHRRGRNQGGRSHPTPRERKTVPPGREMLHRVLASNRPGRTLAAEGVPFAMQESFSRFWALLSPPQEVHVASVPVAKGATNTGARPPP